MSLLDQLSGLYNNVINGNLSEDQTHAHYDQIARQAPRADLGAAIGPALSGMDNKEVHERILNSARQMDTQQRGGIVESLLGAMGGSAGGANIAGLLAQLGINPQVAADPQSATPEEVAKLAARTHSTDPGLFEKAMSFYSAHPTLVKALGTVVIAQIVGNLTRQNKAA